MFLELSTSFLHFLAQLGYLTVGVYNVLVLSPVHIPFEFIISIGGERFIDELFYILFLYNKCLYR